MFCVMHTSVQCFSSCRVYHMQKKHPENNLTSKYTRNETARVVHRLFLRLPWSRRQWHHPESVCVCVCVYVSFLDWFTDEKTKTTKTEEEEQEIESLRLRDVRRWRSTASACTGSNRLKHNNNTSQITDSYSIKRNIHASSQILNLWHD